MGKKKSKKVSRSAATPVEATVEDDPIAPADTAGFTMSEPPVPEPPKKPGSALVQGPAAHDPNRIMPVARITASAWGAANLHFIHAQGFNAWAGLKKLDRLTSAEWEAHYAAYTNSKVG